MNVFNGFYARASGSGAEWATDGETNNFYLQIQCPEMVRVWRVALRVETVTHREYTIGIFKGQQIGENSR